jgi:RIO kinase 1
VDHTDLYPDPESDLRTASRRGGGSRTRSRWDDEERDDTPSSPRRRRAAPTGDGGSADGADVQPAYSTWGDALHGPAPLPDWVVTALGAVDTELGVLKTGKEADVFLVERAVPDVHHDLDDAGPPGSSSLLAAKRYRSSEHRLFHRDAGYLEGRRVRRSRETRAMARRTDFGRELIAGQWAMAEFEALATLWTLTGETAHRPLVPYPVQLRGRELMLEFIGEPDGAAAPRLAELRPDPDQLVELWHQMLDALGTLALAGLAHGDLSAYNVLVHRGRLVLIDLPQVVEVVSNPQGGEFLARDVRNIARWFIKRGVPPRLCDVDRLITELGRDAGLR